VRPFTGRRVLVGVTGGIASYKTTWLVRLLHKAGAEVDVVLTRSAREFVGSVTFEALTGRPVHTELIAPQHALDHIRLAREAAAIVIAPATADFLSRAAHGNADELLSAILLATKSPVVLAPAMNDAMWSHRQTQANVARCGELGYRVVEPETGDLAAGEGSGPGRMPEPATIFAHVGRALEAQSLRGKSFLVTAGPTREPVDPVRFISNRSSGKMGVAIAAAAWRRGAEVTLVHGPLEVAIPVGPRAIAIDTTESLRDAVGELLPGADALVMAAAPGDFRAVNPAASKIKKANAGLEIALEHTPDVLAETKHQRRKGAVVVGFALETDNAVEHARTKLSSKDLDAIVLNDARESGAGFGGDTNRVTILFADGREDALPLLPKTDVADAILDRVEPLLNGR
jgi:phosphopantothenoylcysteine decarboxylase/phosphopantothenate--cysteine ligase